MQAIKDRRTQAIRSGMSTSGLAALEMQNIQTAQLGAQQVMQEYLAQNAALAAETAGAGMNNRYYMGQSLMENYNNIAAVDAQKFGSSQLKQFTDALGMSDPQAFVGLLKSLGIELDGTQEAQLASYFSQGVDTTSLKEKYGELAYGDLFDGDEPMKYGKFIRQHTDATSARSGINSDKKVDAYETYLKQFNKVNKTSYSMDYKGYKSALSKGYKK